MNIILYNKIRKNITIFSYKFLCTAEVSPLSLAFPLRGLEIFLAYETMTYINRVNSFLVLHAMPI